MSSIKALTTLMLSIGFAIYHIYIVYLAYTLDGLWTAVWMFFVIGVGDIYYAWKFFNVDMFVTGFVLFIPFWALVQLIPSRDE